MKWIGKLTGGLLGAVALGPMGAALGVLLGHQFDEHAEELQARWSGSGDAAAIGERFFRATFRVMGYLAKADGRVSEQEMRAALEGNNLEGPVRPLMGRVATSLGVSPLELVHVEAVARIRRGAFRADETPASPAARDRALEAAYRVLGTDAAASDEALAKAYRRQLSRHHPDKLKANGLPESMMAHAKQRTQQIIEAYELVRERRGMT